MVRKFILGLLTLTLLAACSDDKEPNDGSLSVEPLKEDNPLIYGSGGEIKLGVVSSGEWRAELDNRDAALWVTLEKHDDGLTVSTRSNDSDNDRTAQVRVTDGINSQSFKFTQRRNIFRRRVMKERRVSNGFSLIYDSKAVTITRAVGILPIPESNLYQDIEAWSAPGCQQLTATDGHTRYIRREVTGAEVPASGDNILEEVFTIRNYSVETDFDAVTSPVAVDEASVPYRDYTSAIGDIVVPTLPALCTIADDLWRQAGGDILRYARLSYEYIARTMRYFDPDTGLHPLEQILAEGGGDCGNQATVFVSLMRNKKIPARHVVMIRTGCTSHVRSEFYLGGYGWIPVDVQAKNADPSGDYFGRVFSDEIVENTGVNVEVLSYDSSLFTSCLLQTELCWYWYTYQGANPEITISHIVKEINR